MSLVYIQIGAVSVHSYASVAEADTHLAVNSVYSTTWASASLSDKELRLVEATSIMDTLVWRGAPTSSTQPHRFPRSGLLSRDNIELDSSLLPLEVEQATSLLAGILLQRVASGSAVPAAAVPKGITKVTAGPVEIEFSEGTAEPGAQDPADQLPQDVVLLVQHLLVDVAGRAQAASTTVGSPETFELPMEFKCH